MKRRSIFIVLVVIIVLMIIGLRFSKQNGFRHIAVNGATIAVSIADMPKEREKGLSGKEALAENEGIWFSFDEPGYWGIWMKDMRFPIDIVWLDGARRIVSVKERVAPDTYPEVFRPEAPAKYVLELPAGAAMRYGFATGTVVAAPR